MRNVVFASSIEDPMGSYTFMTGSVVLGHCDHAHLISWFSVWMFDCSRACPPFLIILYPSWPRLLMMLSTFFFLKCFHFCWFFPHPPPPPKKFCFLPDFFLHNAHSFLWITDYPLWVLGWIYLFMCLLLSSLRSYISFTNVEIIQHLPASVCLFGVWCSDLLEELYCLVFITCECV